MPGSSCPRSNRHEHGSIDQTRRREEGELSSFPVWEEEDLFARDFEGRLIRIDKATAADLEETIKITVDGHEIEVKKAVPATDEQGNIRRDSQGRVIPRSTTIYDAASQLYREKLHAPNPIPDPLPSRVHGSCRCLPRLRGPGLEVLQAHRIASRPAASCCRPASIVSRRR